MSLKLLVDGMYCFPAIRAKNATTTGLSASFGFAEQLIRNNEA